MKKTSKVDRVNLILIYLAGVKDDKKRNKYWIKKVTGLGIQTIYNSIETLERIELITEKEVGESRAGFMMKQYYLTENGWYKISCFTPYTIQMAKDKLGDRYYKLSNPIQTAKDKLGERRYKELQERVEKATKERIDQLLEMIRSVLTTRKAYPGWFFKLVIRADEHGRIGYKYTVGTEEVERRSRKLKARQRQSIQNTPKSAT